MRQAKVAPCSIALGDMSTGGLSNSARHTAVSMTAAVQVTDTDVAFRVKAAVRRRQVELRKQLHALAEAERTMATFKCTIDGVLTVLVERVEETVNAFKRDESLKEACFRNGWAVLRPRVSETGS